MQRPLLALVLATSAALPASAQTQRPFSIDDLLRHEDIGTTRISPDGAWVAIEHQRPYDQAGSYNLSVMTNALLTDLELYRVDQDEASIRLAAPSHEAGHLTGPFSPDGARMAVFRVTADDLQLGVLTLATGETAWLPFTPELSQFGQTVAWRSPTELVFVARPRHDPPVAMRVGFKVQKRLERLWRTAASGHGASAVYIPSGQARQSRTRAEPSTLVVLDVLAGTTRLLARGEWFDLRLSPDGSQAALLEDAEDLQPRPDRPVRVGDPYRRRRLSLVALDTGAISNPLPEQDLAMYLMTWSPASSALIVFGRPLGGDFDEGGRFWTVSANGRAKPLELGRLTPWVQRTWDGVAVPLASWDADQPVIQARAADGSRVWARPRSTSSLLVPVKEASERIVEFNGRAAIQRADGVYGFAPDGPLLARGQLRDQGQTADLGNPVWWNPSPREMGARTLIDQACLSRLARPVPACLTPMEQDETILAASPNADFLVTRHTKQGASEIRLRTTEGVKPLIELNKDWPDIDWGRVVPVPHPGPNGEPLTSWLLLPPGSAPDARPPVVVEVYPGATPRAAPSALLPGGSRLQNNPAVIAAAGYAFLIVSLPLAPGETRPAAGIADRILVAVDAAGDLGLVDPQRIALIGHSFGGYGVLSAVVQSDRFRAVIASNGYPDLSLSMQLPPFFRVAPEEGVPIGQMVGWGETGQASIGDFAERPQAYVEASPLYQAEAIRTPALLIESDLDTQRMSTLFSALYRRNREAGLVTYFGEGHTYASPGNLRDLHARILDWLMRYLGPP
ncbi:S9 family peptidase [Brevundimonas faecalis]|uniref:Dipeptidyl aminopeptidase/acylaminoacyl peptidase n=1 Tax=Brevundimonas faecalis TaxID=947378 RepID=A0ABV2R7Z7_9CAUL